MVELNLNHTVRDENLQDTLYLKKVVYVNIVHLGFLYFSVYGSKLDFSDL